MRIYQQEKRGAEINIVPMIDIIFSILAYFIISTLYLTKSEGLPVNLPQASTAQQQPSTEFTVTVQPDGNVFLNQDKIEASRLSAGLQNLIDPVNPALVILNADEAVNYGVVVEVIDQIRQVEGAKLAIAAKRSKTNQSL